MWCIAVPERPTSPGRSRSVFNPSFDPWSARADAEKGESESQRQRQRQCQCSECSGNSGGRLNVAHMVDELSMTLVGLVVLCFSHDWYMMPKSAGDRSLGLRKGEDRPCPGARIVE